MATGDATQLIGALLAPAVETVGGGSRISERPIDAAVRVADPLSAPHRHPFPSQVGQHLPLAYGEGSFARPHIQPERGRPGAGDASPGRSELETRAARTDARAKGTGENTQTQSFVLVTTTSPEGVHLAPLRDPQNLAVGEYDFGPACLVGPDPVAGKERHVADRLVGAGLIGPLQGNATQSLEEPSIAVPEVLSEARGGQ